MPIEKLPEGVYLATSDEVRGLVAQGCTILETIEIARGVAKKLIERVRPAIFSAISSEKRHEQFAKTGHPELPLPSQ